MTTGDCLAALEQLVRTETRGRIAALLVEPMQGTAGNVIPPPDFLPRLARAAHELGVLFIADEMITGWGRTGRLFGCEHTQTEPDILVFGKGVAAGYPVSGLVTSDAILARAGRWAEPSHSSSSYGGAPLGAAAADAVTRVIVETELEKHAAAVGRELLDELQPLTREHDFVTSVRGIGLFIGVDLDVDHRGCKEIFRGCLERGLISMAYTRRVRINPPLCLTREQAREGAALFKDALAAWAKKRR